MAKRPAGRWRSMRELAEQLGAWLDGTPAALPSSAPALPPAGPALTLRVPGTSLAYRAAPGQRVVTLGRQKRRPGEPPEAGNDVVLRVPGNDELSARISRRHLEVRREGDGFVALDRSKAGTLLNGRPLARDEPTPLAAGDRLVVAGVINLEVDLAGRPARAASATEARFRVAGPDGPPTDVYLEATVGDMVTLE
jgi:hypothetical protein